MSYGLRWGDVRLIQISGAARVHLKDDGREWWGRPPAGRPEVYETAGDDCCTWESREAAEQVAKNLER